MTVSESFLPEFDQEMATTRRMLERIPEDNFRGNRTRNPWISAGYRRTSRKFRGGFG